MNKAIEVYLSVDQTTTMKKKRKSKNRRGRNRRESERNLAENGE
jgi:hypothetical protein